MVKTPYTDAHAFHRISGQASPAGDVVGVKIARMLERDKRITTSLSVLILVWIIACVIGFLVCCVNAEGATLTIHPVKGTSNLTLSWDVISPSNPIVAGIIINCNETSYRVAGNGAGQLTISNLPTPGSYAFTAQSYSAAGAVSALSPEVDWTFPMTQVAVCVTNAAATNIVLQVAPSPERSAPWFSFVTNRQPFSVVLPVNSEMQFYRTKNL